MQTDAITAREFEELFRENYLRYYYYAYDILEQAEESRDVVGEAFLAVWKNREHVNREKLRAYLFTSVKNKCLTVVSKHRGHYRVGDDAVQVLAAETEEEWLEREERIGRIEQEMQHLPERTRYVLKQCFGLLLAPRLVVMELDDDHQFATGTVTEDDVAQQSHLSPQVEERQPVGHGIVAYLVAYAVLHVVHQPALLYGQYLVERPRDVESDGRHILQAWALFLGQHANLLFRQIPFVGASEVQLVAVLLRLHRAEDWPELRQRYLADACQLVLHLLLLELQLFLIGQVLPLTASADAEVLTEGHGTNLARLHNPHHLALGKRVLLAPDLNVAHVAWHAPGHKHHQVLPVEQAFPLGSHRFNGDAL